ncbi:uncharacterized protein JN550_010077 [Neoarthrinium moseri]|uniref:uncharacterized protein n=1 Tax=Neoarthrinium moseri TaxID=1658444 RepID=UPI001FDC76F9|nr:uncharacterized protein JN550_010077 [Neoarthrinium moseri]KAI1862740.1 hypothetical protein JN550_010077 [Neoarthrinium moseri]
MEKGFQGSGTTSDNVFYDAEFSNTVAALLEEHHVPGVSIAFVDKGSVSVKGFGIAQYPNVAAKPETLYFTGSTTKAMLAAATGIVMRQEYGMNDPENLPLQLLKKDKWATKIKSILATDFELEDEYATSNVTIEDALSHRSGMESADLIYGTWMGNDPKGIVQALKHLGPLNKQFRTTWQYNNLMYSVVGDLLKSITGVETGVLLKKLLWNPLYMNSTFWALKDIPDAQRQDLARGYYWVAGPPGLPESEGYHVPEPYIDFAGIAPAGATISSVIDYGKWIKELLRVSAKDPKLSDNGCVLTPELFSELTAPRSIMEASIGGSHHKHLNLSAYGLGWIIQPPLAGIDHPIVSHSGGLNGFKTQLFLLPNDDFGCVCMGNGNFAHITGEVICLELIARRLGLSAEAKAKIIDLAKGKYPAPATADASADTKVVGTQAPKVYHKESAQDLSEDQVKDFFHRVAGEYSHPAYGAFRVSDYERADKGPVIYNHWTSQSDRNQRDQQRTKKPCLLFSPIGHRTWKFQILLHARDDFGEMLRLMISGTKPEGDWKRYDLFFDSESLDGHGNIEDDVVAGFPAGGENPGDKDSREQDKKTELRLETVWNSQFLSEFGAAFRFSPESRKHTPEMIGLRLAEKLDGMNGSKNAGWEKEMIWFTRSSGAEA